MITLIMEKYANNQIKPVEHRVEDKVYKYKHINNKSKEEFFKILENYLNYKIKVIKQGGEGNILQEKNYTIKDVRRTMNGVMELD